MIFGVNCKIDSYDNNRKILFYKGWPTCVVFNDFSDKRYFGIHGHNVGKAKLL